MSRIHSHKKKNKKKAKQEIETILYHLCHLAKTFAHDPEKADLLVRRSLRIARKTNVRLSKEQKYFICRTCHSFLSPGSRARIRFHQHRCILLCKQCKHITRIPYKATKPPSSHKRALSKTNDEPFVD
ncbi:MAG: hypothetical protein QW594_01040 [Candidatus Woesearchaeota archaeon]